MSNPCCAECGTPAYGSFGSTKAGDLVEHMQGKRDAKNIRCLCEMCATFYCNTRFKWLRPLWFKLPLPMRKIFKIFGICAFNPVV